MNESVTISLDRYHAMQNEIREARELRAKLITFEKNYKEEIEADVNVELLTQLALDAAVNEPLMKGREVLPDFSLYCYGRTIAANLDEENEEEEI